MKVFFYGTVYNFLLFLLINKDWEKCFFCFSSVTPPEIIKYFKKRKLKFYLENDITKYKNSLLKNIFRVIKKLKNYVYIIKIYLMKATYYGYDDGYLSRVFVGPNFYVIEDGLSNYLGYDRIKLLMEKHIIGYGDNYIPYGYDDSIEKIYLTGAVEIPHEIKQKVELINIQDLWDKKTDNEKEEILAIFGLGLNYFNKWADKEYVLLTQPFDEVGVIDENEKIALYKKILSNYDHSKIIIKVHPKEVTNYGKYFPEIQIIDNKFPFELMLLTCDNLSKIITLRSTCAFNIKKKIIIDLYDERGNKKVYDKLSFESIFNNGFSIEVPIKDNIKKKESIIAQFLKQIERKILWRKKL